MKHLHFEESRTALNAAPVCGGVRKARALIAMGATLRLCAACAGSDDAGATSGSSTGSGVPGSSSESTASYDGEGDSDDSIPDCNVPNSKVQPLLASNVYALRVAGDSAYFVHESGMSKVQLGDTTGSSIELLVENGGGLYLSDESIATCRYADDGTGELVWFPLAGGQPERQTVPNGTLIDDGRYRGPRTELIGNIDYYPFSYYIYDPATGQSREYATQLMGHDENQMLADANDIYVALNRYPADTSSEEVTPVARPTELYRVAPGATEAEPMVTGIPDAASLTGIDANYLYLWVSPTGFLDSITGANGGGGELFGLYRLPRAGGVAERMNLPLKSGWLFQLFATEAGTFIYNYDGTSYKLYRVGPDAVDSANPVLVNDRTWCNWKAAWSSGDTMYAAFEDVRKYWLLSAPIAELGNAIK